MARALLGAGGLSALMLGAAAQAQTQTQAQEAENTPALGEVVVKDEAESGATEGSGSFTTTRPVGTAAKLGLSLRETPQSVTVVTRERMDQQGLVTLGDVLNASPGIYTSTLDTERRNYISRGYTVDNFQVDGMLNTFSGYTKTNGDMIAYDRVEIVRGAAGLTTGAGDPSATVNLIRKRPARQFKGQAGLTLGNHALRRGEVDIGGPLAFDGRLRGRLALAHERAESFRPFYRTRNSAAYGILEADLTPATTAAVGFEWQKNAPRGVTWGTVPYWNADGSVANLPYNLNLTAPWTRWGADEKKAFATLEHHFNADWRLRASASHARRESESKLYYGGNGNPRPDGSGISAWWGAFPGGSRMNVLDVNVDGKFHAWGRQHEVVAGWGLANLQGYSDAVVNATMPASYSQIPDWRNWTGDIPEFGSTKQPWRSSDSRTRQSAGYLATRLHVAEPLKLILGLRVGTYKTHTDNFNAATGARTSSSGYRHSSVLTPYAGLVYDFTPQWSAYASYTDIFKPQDRRDKNNNLLDPEVGKSYELGVKGELLDKRLNVAAAIFRSKKDKMTEVDDSVPANSLPSGGTAYRYLGDGNTIDGIELEAVGQITRQWNLFAGYSHTRSRNAKGEPFNTVVPRNLLRLFSSYSFGEGQRWTVGGGLNWQSSLWNSARRPTGRTVGGRAETVASRIDQKGLWTASLMASYRISSNLSASLHVSNLFDKRYYSRVGFYNGVYAAEPRTIRLTLKAHF